MYQDKTSQRALATLAVAAVLALPAAAVAGAPIAGPFAEPDDHFLCYKAGLAKADKNKSQKDTALTLQDLYDTGAANFVIKKEKGVCVPADKNAEGIVDADIHYVAYQVKGEAKHEKQLGIRVVNQFGTHYLDTKKEDRLFVPANKNPVPHPNGSAPDAPVSVEHNVDHMKCYKAGDAKGFGKFVPQTVTGADQWTATKSFVVKKPKLFCAPVDKNGEGLKNADGYQVCYQVKPDKGEPKHTAQSGIWFTDQFNAKRFGTKKEELLCVPSLADVPDQYCGDATVNQTGEQCDADAAPCGVGEICTGNCLCSLCGNDVVDAGEQCEVDTDCPQATQECEGCTCVTRPALGQRAFTFSNASGFFSSFLPIPVGVPVGAFVLDAGPLNHDGDAAVSLASAATFGVDISLGASSTVCYEVSNCVGTLYCNGGVNVDTLNDLDSLVNGLSCVRDGTNSCGDDPSSVCCSNSCEGSGVGSGNAAVLDLNVGVGDTGAGALELLCDTRAVIDQPFGADCSLVNYSGEPVRQAAISTGTATSIMTNHCAGTTPANQVPTAVSPGGVNFSCAAWTTTDGPGRLDWALGAEEPSPLVAGDGANILVLSD